MVYTQVQGEVTVGGVFLRLFISQPTWVLRKPKEFLIALLEKFGQLTQSSNPDVRHVPSFFSRKLCEKEMWITALGFACGSPVYFFVEIQRFVNCFPFGHLAVLSKISIAVHFLSFNGSLRWSLLFLSSFEYPKQTVLLILLSVCSVTGLSPPPLSRERSWRR